MRGCTHLRFVYGLLVVAATSLARPAPAQEPSEPARVGLSAQLEQSTLAELDARLSTAQARSAAAESYFEGKGEWERAFPNYVDISLGNVSALATRREILHRRALTRALERVANPPAALSAPDARRWLAARDAAVAAEESADAAEARFVAGLEAALEQAPGLGDLSVERRFRELSDCMAVPVGADSARKDLAVLCGAEDHALRRWRRAAWTAVTRPGDPTLSLLVSDALSAQPLHDAPADVRLRGTLDRLSRVRPLLTARATDADAWIDAADELLHGQAVAALDEPIPAPAHGRPVPEIEADLAALRVRLDEERKAAEPIATDPASTALAVRLANGRVDRIERSIADLERALDPTRSRDDVDSEPTAPTGPSVGERQQEADDAARRAADARTPAEATVLAATAAVRKQTVEVVDAESARRTSALAQLAEWRRELDAAKTALSDGLARASLDPERQSAIDEAYFRVRDLTRALNAGAAESDRALADARREAASLPVPEPAAGDVDADMLVERDDATADLAAVLRARSLTLESERNALVDLFVKAKHARRAARAHASRTATAAGRQAFLPAVVAEVREVELVAAGRIGATLASLRAIPRALTDITFIGALLMSSLRFLLVLLVWRILRGGAEGWIRAVVERVAAANPRDETFWAALARFRLGRLEAGDPLLLVEPTGRVVRGLLDAAAAAFVAEYVGSRLPLFGLFAWIWFAVVIWRTAPRLIDLLFATPGEGRPSVRRIEEATRTRLLRAVRWLLAWRLATLLLDQALLGVLAADKLTQLVDAISAVAGVVIVLFLMYDWADPIRRATAAAEPTTVSRWAATAGSPLMVVPRAVVGAAVLAGAWVSELFTELTRSSSRTDLRWLGALLARRQLGADADVEGSPLDGAIRERVSAFDRGTPPNVEATISRLLAVHAEWAVVRRRGLVAVIGDRGSGVEQIGDRISERLTTPTVLRVPHRFGRPEEAIGWLAQALGRSGSDPVALAHSLAADRGRVVVLLDTHRLFLRTVGGFAVLRAIFDVLQATSEEMFWVVVMNAPTWRFLQGTPGAVDVGVFRPPIDVGGLTDRDLAAWLLEPVRAAGLDPSFRLLCRTPDPERVDPRAVERAMRLYFRLLSDASQGRPAAARSLWLSSLRGGAAPNRIEHAVPASASAREIDSLRDEDLFLCTSLALHGELDIPTLSVVLNRDPGVIRSACRRLESFGILRGDENAEWFDLDETLHPLVLRVLRHRAFLGAAA